MLGDVGHPQAIAFVAGELAVYQIRRGRQVRHAPPFRAARQPGDARLAHHQFDLTVAHGDAPAQRQFGVHPTSSVRAPRGGVDLTDLIGQPGVTDSPRRGWPILPGVVARLRHAQHATGGLHRQVVCGHQLDGRVPPFGSACSLSSSVARRWIATSASSSRIRFLRRGQLRAFGRRRARFESAFDAVLTPPRVDRLRADPQVASDIRDLAAGVDQIQHPAAELRRIAPSSHAALLGGSSMNVQSLDSTEPRPDQVSIRPRTVQLSPETTPRAELRPRRGSCWPGRLEDKPE
jgi:hypothetical protein